MPTRSAEGNAVHTGNKTAGIGSACVIMGPDPNTQDTQQSPF